MKKTGFSSLTQCLKERFPAFSFIVQTVVLVGTLLGIGLIVQQSHFLMDILQHKAIFQGVWGKGLFLGIGILICSVGLPRQAVCFVAGFLYGVVFGIAFATLITLVGSVLAFMWARWIGREKIQKLLRRKGPFAARIRKVHEYFTSSPFFSVLGLRLMPVGSALAVNVASGLSHVPMASFIWATLIGSLPQTVIFVLLGSGIQVGNNVRLIISAILLVLSIIAGVFVLQANRAKSKPNKIKNNPFPFQ
ncbi:TVP38/TMEM64 family protein [Entomobacter blattae]|uniref:TVP38/TMEM64 family membrane protein n=1 Tax=Entomobacter blattae TaxID=2762277 RepID=A0A7H1NNY8_9PROT|nr:VTT domain-containing protein [Entomobacter blattae]QNT77498.1 SNARE associated Golgi protein [Entomobacter blattae]